MATSGWVSIIAGQSGQTVSDALDAALAAIDTEIDKIEAVGGIFDRIIASENDIIALQAAQPFVHQFEFAQFLSVSVPTDVYSEVGALHVVSLPGGTYKLDMSMIYSLNSVTNSAFFRFSLDNGINWVEVRREPKDNTDKIDMSYDTVIQHISGNLDIIIQSRKGNASDTLLIDRLDIMLDRKG